MVTLRQAAQKDCRAEVQPSILSMTARSTMAILRMKVNQTPHLPKRTGNAVGTVDIEGDS